MKGIIQSVSALILGVSSLAFTGSAQADSGLTVVYSSHGYGHRAYPVKPYYYSHKPGWYGRSCAVTSRHYHHKHDYGYGHRKHDSRHDRHGGRDHDRKFGERYDSRRTHSGYASINRN
jgi:hypothetical protein